MSISNSRSSYRLFMCTTSMFLWIISVMSRWCYCL